MKMRLGLKMFLIMIIALGACDLPKSNGQNTEINLDNENPIYGWLISEIDNFVFNEDSLQKHVNQDISLLTDSIKTNYDQLSDEEIVDSLNKFIKYFWEGNYNERDHMLFYQKEQDLILYGIYRKVPKAFAQLGSKYVDFIYKNQPNRGYKNYLYLIHSVKLGSKDGILSLANIALYFKRYKKYEKLLIESAEAGQPIAALELHRLYSDGIYSDGNQDKNLINNLKADYFFEVALNLNSPQAWKIKADKTIDEQEAFEYMIKSFELMNEDSYMKKIYIDSYQYLGVTQELSKRFGDKWEEYKRKNGISDL